MGGLALIYVVVPIVILILIVVGHGALEGFEARNDTFGDPQGVREREARSKALDEAAGRGKPDQTLEVLGGFLLVVVIFLIFWFLVTR
jgi:hypothetical protein